MPTFIIELLLLEFHTIKWIISSLVFQQIILHDPQASPLQCYRLNVIRYIGKKATKCKEVRADIHI
jgi:hypothetical protein